MSNPSKAVNLYTDETGISWIAPSVVTPTQKYASSKGNKGGYTGFQTEEDLLGSPLLKEAKEIRILGLPSNAQTICSIISDRYDGENFQSCGVYVGTPANCRHKLDDVDFVFESMENLWGLPRSCGGWRMCVASDYVNYALVQAITYGYGNLGSQIDKLYKGHPAYLATSFVPSSSLRSCATMVSQIIDPRWFIDPANPNRLARLRSYMGLTEENISKILSGVESGSKNFHRALTVYKALFAGADPNASLDSSASFFAKKVMRAKTTARGVLRACSSFLHFVRDVWLHVVVTPNRVLFVPEYFFEDNDVADDYRLHVLKVVNGAGNAG